MTSGNGTEKLFTTRFEILGPGIARDRWPKRVWCWIAIPRTLVHSLVQRFIFARFQHGGFEGRFFRRRQSLQSVYYWCELRLLIKNYNSFNQNYYFLMFFFSLCVWVCVCVCVCVFFLFLFFFRDPIRWSGPMIRSDDPVRWSGSMIRVDEPILWSYPMIWSRFCQRHDLFWTDVELDLLVHCALVFKSKCEYEGLSWEGTEAKYDKIKELAVKRYPKKASDNSNKKFPRISKTELITKERISAKPKKMRKDYKKSVDSGRTARYRKENV